ncbi:DUF4142 domain-containing protein [Sabulicella rubraurantiaca]|uniref:DUF4142 domain-containing protein n=1 Tax=Sabulicella rubraurantiaca TaxID=2811429 RepID=UPI001A97BD77|nr:DUF4142 domain-containing protein [Sabulicella rubraurantiaca]
MLQRRNAGLALMGSALLLPTIARAQGAMEMRTAALTAGTAALQSAQSGMRRASNPAVRQFAQLEAEEQMATMEAMRMAGVTIPQTVSLPADKMQAMQRMEAMSGTEFDRAFLQSQLEGHQELLRIHSSIAQSGNSTEERIIGTMAVPAIKSHIATIEMLLSQQRG